MRKRIIIEGMICKKCAGHVKEALKQIDNVISAEIDLDAKMAVLEATKEISDAEIIDVVCEAGYDVVGIENL